MTVRISTLFAAFLLTCGASQAASPKLKDCLGSVDQRISVENFNKCEALTRSKKLTARQKAQLFLQLGITVETDQLDSRSTRFKGKITLPVEYWEKAIAADKTYAESYLILATTVGYRQQPELKRQFLEAGRIAAPEDPRFDSEIALIDSGPTNSTLVRELCNRSMAHPAADKSIFYNCGEAFWRSDLKAEAGVAFRKAAFEFPVEQTPRYGIMQSGIDESTFADHLSNDGKAIEAASFYEKYLGLKHKLNVTYSALGVLGGLYEKAGKPAEAATVFEKAARNATGEWQYIYRLRQIVNLATAGESDEAKTVSNDFFEKASKKQVLLLQLKLKNGWQKHLIITGKYDEETKAALKNCIADSGCFAAKPGQLL